MASAGASSSSAANIIGNVSMPDPLSLTMRPQMGDDKTMMYVLIGGALLVAVYVAMKKGK